MALPLPPREHMVQRQLLARGIVDAAVLRAMAEVPREEFVPAAARLRAYDDNALSIGEGQTISQPYVVALMCQALRLRPEARVLDVGSGSGYAAAVLSGLASEVFGVELLPRLARRAGRRLRKLGYANVRIAAGDGTLGLPAEAPFDAIHVAAGAQRVPEALLEQLAPGGRLVIPLGPTRSSQELRVLQQAADGGFESEFLCDVRFVPLLGARGWGSRDPRRAGPTPDSGE